MGGQCHLLAALPRRKNGYQFNGSLDWSQARYWRFGKSRPHRGSIPERPILQLVAILTKLSRPNYHNIKPRNVIGNTEINYDLLHQDSWSIVTVVTGYLTNTKQALGLQTHGQTSSSAQHRMHGRFHVGTTCTERHISSTMVSDQLDRSCEK